MKKVMKSMWILALLMMGSPVAMAQEEGTPGEQSEQEEQQEQQTPQSPEVTVDIATFTGGSITEESQEAVEGGVKVTITVTPEMGYSIAKGDIKVYPTMPASQTREGEGVSVADVLPLSYNGDANADVVDKTAARDYTFTVPAGMGAWVKEATFHSALNISKDENSEVVWSYDAESKALTISGTGSTYDFTGEGFEDPWASFRAQIETVTVTEGVTSLGAKIFDGCTALTTITIQNATSVVTFGDDAVPANVTVDVPGNLYNAYAIDGVTIASTTGVEMTGVAFEDLNQYDTFVSDQDLQVPSVLKAYTITGINGSELVLAEVTTIPAGTPVLLYSESLKSGDIRTATAAATGETGTPTSLLKVAPAEGKEVALGEVYLLHNDVFYYAQAGTIPTGGIYLQPESASGTRGYYALTRGTTAIDSQRIVSLDSKAPWYTLDGRKLSTMPSKKGIYIKDGKKVIIK